MEEMKRKPIRQRVQLIVMQIAVIALLTASLIGVVSMLRIKNQSEEALTANVESQMFSLVTERANAADIQLNQYGTTIDRIADYIHRLYTNSAEFIPVTVMPPLAENGGKLSLQRALTSTDVTLENVGEELELLGNVGNVFRTVIEDENSLVTSIYIGSASGFMIAYDRNADLSANPDNSEVYFDYTESTWYTGAIEIGGIFFSDVYYDYFGRGLTITCSTPFYDENNQLAGVAAMDILISDLYKSTVQMELDSQSYAFIVDGNGNLITEEQSDVVVSLKEDEGMDEKTAAAILSGEKGFALSESDIYYAYHPIENVGWTLVIHTPKEVALATVSAMEKDIRGSVWVFVGFLVVIGGIVTLVVNKFSDSLTRPLRDLGKEVLEISSGNLDNRASIHSNDEIGDLAKTFNEMAGSLKKYIEDLTKVTAEKERIGAELNVATQIQADMLPSIFPAFPERTEFDIYATMNPAKEVGGDFYDFFLIDEDHIALVMADVSGKGVPAALFMVIAKTLLKNRAQLGSMHPSQILADVNDQLCEGNEAELFVTVWMAIIEISTGKGIAANAGHEHPVLRRKDGYFEFVEYKHAPPLAVMDGIPFKEHEFQMNKGDTIFVYTDGVPEATNAESELFGPDRLLAALNKRPDLKVEDILKAVKGEVDAFVGDAPQFDDLTMLAFHLNDDQN